MFTADLMRKINIQSDVVFIKLASYNGTTSSGEVKEHVHLKWLKNIFLRRVISKTIVDLFEDIEKMGHNYSIDRKSVG